MLVFSAPKIYAILDRHFPFLTEEKTQTKEVDTNPSYIMQSINDLNTSISYCDTFIPFSIIEDSVLCYVLVRSRACSLKGDDGSSKVLSLNSDHSINISPAQQLSVII